MNSDEYQKVKEIFQSALDLSAEDRVVYLDENCSTDPVIRREVERLLSSYKPSYLETPAVANLDARNNADGLRSGQQIGHFTIVEKIGSGGMGEVYLAEDCKLGRRVAIKLLSGLFTNDEERLGRFQQEARTASALNHPNILTIHDFGASDGTHYIATEFIDGETLRERLYRGRQSIRDSLDIAIQTASALAAAHEAGIVHRDIKPENIMLRTDRLVKVLDFGLAKLSVTPATFGRSQIGANTAPTERHVLTEPGVIMGTVQYMSPEQTRGQALDVRSDIWSLGCVIYEMLVGTPPFEGDNSGDLIAEIVKSHPTPVTKVVTDIPERFEEIVDKTLEKDPDERYQTAKDLLIDLKRLQKKLEMESELERSNPRLDGDDVEAGIPGSQVATSPTKVSSVEYIVVGMKLHKRTAIGLAAALIALIGGTAYVARTYWRSSNDARFTYAKKIKLAVQALETSNLTMARQLLDETKPKAGEEDLRDFEWGYISQLHAERSASQPLRLQHRGMVDAVAFASDNNSLATAGGGDNIVRLWDVATGNMVREFVGHTDLVVSVDFSPDQTKLLTGSFDKTARVWDVETGRELLKLPSQAASLTFLPDGKRFAGVDGSMKVWDSVTGTEITSEIKLPDVGFPFSASRNGRLFAAQNGDKAAVVWEAATGRVIQKLDGKSGLLTDIEFSPDSKTLLTGNSDGTARLWDLKTGKELKAFRGHSAPINDVLFSPIGKTVATGSEDDTIKVWDADGGFEIATLRGHSGDVVALGFSPDGRKLASGGSDSIACLWNVPTTGGGGVLRGHSAEAKDVRFSTDGKLLASASEDKTARIWEVATERERRTLTGNNEAVESAAFSPNGKLVATGSRDGKVFLWDVITGRRSLSFDTGAGITRLSFSPNGSSIATGHFWHGRGAGLWDVASGSKRCGFDVGPGGAWDVQFSNDGKRITASFGDDAVRTWDAATCDELSVFKGAPEDEYGSTFKNGSTLIAMRILNNRHTLELIDPETGKEIAAIEGHNAPLNSATLSPNGKRLVTSGEDSLIKIWDTATGLELLTIKVGANVNTTAFSPNGKILAGAVADGTVRLWRSE